MRHLPAARFAKMEPPVAIATATDTDALALPALFVATSAKVVFTATLTVAGSVTAAPLSVSVGVGLPTIVAESVTEPPPAGSDAGEAAKFEIVGAIGGGGAPNDCAVASAVCRFAMTVATVLMVRQ
jgi:hypothetical protein